MANGKGMFITVEGGEGVGKSTNMVYIQSILEAAGKEVVVTREPGGTTLSEQIREILLDKTQQQMVDDTELLLVFAARAQHLAEVIRPAIESGKWVLCDRFTDATYAYQGGGRGIEQNRIAQLEQWVQGAFQPDLTLLLDVPVDVGMGRASQRGELDRFETEEISFFERVRDNYRQRAAAQAERFRIIDASKELSAVQQQLSQVLEAVL